MNILLFFLASVPVLYSASPANRPRFSAIVAEARQKVPEISVLELEEKLQNARAPVFLIDVREESEWAAGNLPGAVHLSRGVLEREIEALATAPDADIILYCASGGRAALAGESLRRMGYARVVNLRGGYSAWLDAARARQ